MSVLPAPKYFRLVKGGTFDYSFQFLNGSAENATPVDLTGYNGTWTLHTVGSPTTYSTGALAGHSGVFFGGPTNDLTTGIIDLVISAADTAAITWTNVTYNFSISALVVVTPLLTGAIAVVNTLP